MTGREGDAYSGAMRVKVGPIVVDYGGTLTFEDLDRDQRRAVLLAVGEETAGQGSAEAHIVSSVLDVAEGARVIVETDLQVRGRVAQFGSGPMEKIAKRMFEDFAKNLETAMTSPEQSGPQDGGADGGGTGQRKPEEPRRPAAQRQRFTQRLRARRGAARAVAAIGRDPDAGPRWPSAICSAGLGAPRDGDSVRGGVL